MKKIFLWMWAFVTVLMVISIIMFEIVPRYKTYGSIAASEEATGLLRCVGRRPNCLSSEWSDRGEIQKRCSGMPCLGLGENYEYKLVELDGQSYAVARMKLPSGASSGSSDIWFDPLDTDSTGAFQCRDRTATAGVFRPDFYQPTHPICAQL